MTASVPSRIALATSATSARVGRDEVIIESSICVAVIDGRAIAPASASRRFWIDRHLLDRQLDAEVAARDHDAVGRRLRISSTRVDALRLLDLRDQRRARVLAHEEDVLGPAHEAQGHEVDPDLDAGPQVGEVLLRHRGQHVERPGDVEALARGDGAADLDLRVDLVRRRRAPRSCAGAPRRRRGRGSRPDRSSRRGRPRLIDMRRPSPASPLTPHTNVTGSPVLSSATSSRSAPMRSLGPGRSCRIATGRPARPAASRIARAVSACCSAVPWLKFSRATSIPASTMRTRTSRSREAGPMVATIFVRRSMSAPNGRSSPGRGRAVRRRASPASSSEPGEHGEHAAMVVLGGRQAELAEDVRHVLLDGAVGDDERPARARLIPALRAPPRPPSSPRPPSAPCAARRRAPRPPRPRRPRRPARAAAPSATRGGSRRGRAPT